MRAACPSFSSKIGVKKVGGGSVTDSFLVKGVAFKKTFSYAGFEQQPKSFDNPGVLLLNVELELKSEKVGHGMRHNIPFRVCRCRGLQSGVFFFFVFRSTCSPPPLWHARAPASRP